MNGKSLIEKLAKEDNFFVDLALSLSEEMKKEALYLANFRETVKKDRLRRELLEREMAR